ncbi:Uncharacterized protein BP5553_08554 [Venustampulla echinocandica]|uniref:Uncharacterized protein n=1 Tax=Venustampulla echinocandica TaxID=2656787 RepID=A0A370TEJ8_9HELO|nr:Uncharacterized protein BP5553_08554 [Venustampulla echinocandica]RDL33115.1 Uncharacterized protein BP5553_08554 [Venustampulla echinocandica]
MTPPSEHLANPSSPAVSIPPIPPIPPGSRKHASTFSIDTKTSVRTSRSRQEYMDSLEMPTREMVERINNVQEQKEEEGIRRRLSVDKPDLNDEEKARAARLIQRNYRGHRERRMINGMSLDPSSRWLEAIKEARYRNLLQPRPRNSMDGNENDMESLPGSLPTRGSWGHQRHGSAAKQNWRKVGLVARRAGGDEDPDSDEESTSEENLPADEREARRKRRAEQKLERQRAAKIMDLQYFLEMVDLKHRYGSNLRTYHQEWKKADTKENFFYWLDYGEGRFIDCQGCSRERLEKEQVRYLSREERLNYLVKINKDGRLCWAKNGTLIDTTVRYKDSIHGIVPTEDSTPAYAPAVEDSAYWDERSSSDGSSTSDSDSDDQSIAANKYTTPEFDNARGIKKIRHVSATTIFNKMLRGSVTKNTWIFVADTSFRLYVGIKQSGTFQHSSFLHGARISAAGSIKIKNGRLSKLSPLSGHYRPPVSNFRAFVNSLKVEGVDMSHVSISRSFAVLVGLEAYVKTRRRGKKLLKKFSYHREKLLSPAELAKREEEEQDKSESAARERKVLEMKQQAEKEEKREHSVINTKLLDKLHITPKISGHGGGDSERCNEKMEKAERNCAIQTPGTGPENAIAPEGTRNI